MMLFDSFVKNPLTRLTVAVMALNALAISIQAQQTRITTAVDNRQRVTLTGHLHPKARPENDQGRVSPSLALSYVTLSLAKTAAQQTDLEQLLKDQQNPGSPAYHHWLTPEEFAQRFGISDADLNTVTSWLQSQGLTIAAVARGRNWIAVNGSAAQVESAFQTEIHQYLADGELHFANATEPSMPAALAGVIRGVRGLNDFRPKPSKFRVFRPDYTSGRNHYLAPGDFATIYDVTPLYTAGIDGTGQKIAVAGQTQINLSDIEAFRNTYNLPANDPQVMLVPNSRNPGVSSNDVAEADLDLEWSGAIARNATLIYVYTYDVFQAIQYAIDQNLAPVVTSSYGACEPETPRSDVLSFQSWAQQGNAQGITWFSASGDQGGADCGDSQNPGLSVDVPASIPEVTGVGGTEFVESTGQYWNATNDLNSASAISYIPETTWNDSAVDGGPSASGGGASLYFTKPSWQTGPGVPSDNARHVPDVAFSASADHDGYSVYTGGSLQVYGGTSVPAPAFAGIAALLNQYLVSGGASAGLGNLNPKLYSLAQSTSNVFHDITTGNNIVTVTCPPRSRSCLATPVGYSAGVGYDEATGLGSIDVYNLVTEWNGGTAIPPKAAAITLLTNVNNIATTGVMYLVATVTGANGVTPSGTVTFEDNGTPLGSVALTGSAGTATATLVLTGGQLPLGSGTISAAYNGGSNSPTASVAVSVTSSGSGSGSAPVINTLVNAASYQQAFAPGSILAVFGSQLAPSTQTAGSIPLPVSMAGVAVLINGVAAPLYYVSSGQLNIQIPYETPANTAVTLSINNNGMVSSRTFTVGAVAPGIFMDQNSAIVPAGSASRGQEIALYITGAGAVSPAVSTGSAPSSSTSLANLPKPLGNTIVTVAGVQAGLAFVGITPGLVGVTQINFVVPAAVSAGTQTVIVSIGGVQSAPVKLTITN